MGQTIRRLGNASLEENLFILQVPQIRAGAEPERYNLSYTYSLRKSSCFNLRKNVAVKLHVLRLGLH